MTDSPQLMRQWRLLQILSRNRYGVTQDELASEFDVSGRTIARDLNLLRRVGFPLTDNTGDHGRKYWAMESGTGIADLGFTFDEAAALYLGRRFLEPFAGTPFWHASVSAFQKISSALKPTTTGYLHKIAAGVHFTHSNFSDYSQRAALIDDLMKAIEDHYLTAITYQSLRSTEPVTLYDIHPYSMVFHKGALYLIAWSVDHGEIRTFKIDRILGAETHKDLLKFEPDEDFDVEEYFTNSFGIFGTHEKPQRVRVKFSRQVVRILEEKEFHPSQELHTQKDGSVIAEYDLATFEEFQSFVLSFGHHAQVLEPRELVERMKSELEAMGKIYRAERIY